MCEFGVLFDYNFFFEVNNDVVCIRIYIDMYAYHHIYIETHHKTFVLEFYLTH